MSDDLDRAAAHRTFSRECFNACWTFIRAAQRTPDEEEEMLRLAMASHFHWTQRPDYAPDKASIACWQLSRVFSLLGEARLATRYAQRARDVVDPDGDPFLLGYAAEAMARAAAVAGNAGERDAHLAEARRLAALVTDEEDRRILETDLDGMC